MSDTTDPHLDEPELVTDFGDGGVPWYLLVFYLSFLTFFTWYVLEHQLPGFLGQKADTTEAPLRPGDPAPDAAAQED